MQFLMCFRAMWLCISGLNLCASPVQDVENSRRQYPLRDRNISSNKAVTCFVPYGSAGQLLAAVVTFFLICRVSKSTTAMVPPPMQHHRSNPTTTMQCTILPKAFAGTSWTCLQQQHACLCSSSNYIRCNSAELYINSTQSI